MDQINSLFNSYVTSFTSKDATPERNRRIVLLAIASLIGIVNLIPFGILAHRQGDSLLAAIELSTALVLFLNLVHARTRKNVTLSVHVGIFCTAVLFTTLYMYGGVNNSAYVWYVTFPLLASYLLGSQHGAVATVLMTIPLMSMMFLVLPPAYFTSYPVDLQIRFLFCYLVVGALAYLFQSSQEKSRRKLSHINDRLETIVHERTADLELTNQQLQREIGEKRRAEQINQTLFRISNAVNTSKDLQELYASIHHALGEIIDLTNFFIALYHKEDGRRSFPYFRDEYDNDEDYTDITSETGSLTGEVLQAGKPLFIDQAGLEERAGRNQVVGTTPKIWLGVPLKVKDEVIGVMATQSYDDPDHFDQKDLEILSSVSDQVALAIERKQSQEWIKQSEEKYRNILKNIQDGYYEVDLAGNFILVNQAMANILGYTETELLGMNNRDYMDKKNARRAFETFNTVYRTGVPAKTLVGELIRKDRSTVPAEAVISLIRDKDAKPIGFRGIVRNITERKSAERERQALEEQLQQAQRLESLGTLAGGVAHDFNNMLGVILGHAELAMVHAPTDLSINDDLKQIISAAHRSADLTRQLLAFARRQTASPKVLDLNATVTVTIKMLRRLIGEEIELEWTPHTGLWPLKIDPVQIDQILTNLCVNARDAIDGVGRITITTGNVSLDAADCNGKCEEIADCVPGGYVLLAISDDGCGIEAETLNSLFDPFFTTKKVGEGTGLGLAMVYGIVKQYDGFIDVHSKPGRGATFKLYFPKSDEAISKAPETNSEKPLNGTETVLLVEDEEPILKMGETVLKQYGYTVLSAQSPEEALVAARQHPGPIDILVTDVIMPEMNGKELFSHITKHRPQIKVLFMSGYTADIIMNRGILEDNVHFLEKPFTVNTLAGKVRDILDLK